MIPGCHRESQTVLDVSKPTKGHEMSISASLDCPERLAYSVKEACAVTGFGKTTLYALISAGRLRAVKIGKRTLIPSSSLNGLIHDDDQVSA